MQGHTVGLNIVYLQQNRLQQHTIASTSVHVLRRRLRVAGDGHGALKYQRANDNSICAIKNLSWTSLLQSLFLQAAKIISSFRRQLTDAKSAALRTYAADHTTTARR